MWYYNFAVLESNRTFQTQYNTDEVDTMKSYVYQNSQVLCFRDGPIMPFADCCINFIDVPAVAFSLCHNALIWDHMLIALAFTTLSCITSLLD